MDPLSVTVSVTTLLTTAAKIIGAAADLRSKYKDAAFMLSAIASECTVVNTSLAIMQSLMMSDREILRSRMTGSILSTFEAALTGCTLTMSVIEEELHSLLITDDDGNLKARRVKYILEQDHLKEMLHQIRGQQMGISLLLQTYQLGTNAEVKKMTSENNDLLRKIATRGRKFYVESIHESERCISAAFSVHTHEGSIFEMSSTIDSRQFDFDDQVTNATAYRRALASLRQKDRLLGTVQPSETWKTVQTHRGKTTQPLSTNSNPKLTGATSDLHIATGLGGISDTTADFFQRAKTHSLTKSIHAVHDSGGNSLEDIGVADLDSIECSPTLFVSKLLCENETIEKELGTQTIEWESPVSSTCVSPSTHPARPSSVLQIWSDSSSENSIKPMASDVKNFAIQDDILMLRTTLMEDKTLEKRISRVSQNASKDFDDRIPSRKAIIGFSFSEEYERDPSLGIMSRSRNSEVVRKLKFVMLGDSYSGKTYAMMKYLRGDTYGIPYAPTVYGSFTSDLTVDGRPYQINWTDTPGQESSDNLRPLAYAGCHVALVMFAIDSPDSFANIKEKWAREIYHYQPFVPKILVGCKSDLRGLENVWQEPVTREQGEAFASCLWHETNDLGSQTQCSSRMKYMECSSFTGEGIEELFEEAARLAICYADVQKSTKRRKRISDFFRRSQAQFV